MNNNQFICNIEQNKLSSVQSSLTKLINAIKNNQKNLESEDLCNIIFINESIDQLVSEIDNLEIKIRKGDINNHISSNIKNRIKDYDHNHMIIKTFLPYMMAFSLMSKK